MKKTMKRNAIVVGALFLAVPGVASAISQGIIGDCVDCHTMHNSEEANPVAQTGLGGTGTSATPIMNLLRMDCIACHAQNGEEKIVDFGGGSAVPQVYHADATGDLAGGNFKYLETSQHKGHNVIDLASALPGAFDNADTNGAPPGKYRAATHGSKFSVSGTFDQFTCAGSVGCHGTRSQLLSGTTGTDNIFTAVKRTGIAAITGAHHANYDGAKDATSYAQYDRHSGPKVAEGYRFIPGLKGYGNETDRWQNVDENSHNEYYGVSGGYGGGCSACHNEGNDEALGGLSARMTVDSNLKVPNNSMSGFCSTCHGVFHSGGNGTDINGNNGVSGAFLRHPSDFTLPGEREYTNYTVYDITAPVARPSLFTAASPDVTTGTGGDMVMCLSCHFAHASEYDYMLRGQYATPEGGTAAMTAGAYGSIATAQGEGFCLACHTTKGVLVENR